MEILPFKRRQLKYPYSPEANWRIAVSRRFNDPIVDDFYFGYVLPLLKAEGNVLECKYAAETPEHYNYWMNKFSLILEVSDIHVLIDFKRSPNMEYEFNRSRFISRNGVVPTLNNNFGIAISRSKDFVKPIIIYLTKYPAEIPRRRSQIIININGSYEESSKKIKEALKCAKKKRFFDLYMAIHIYEKMWVRIGYSEAGEIKAALITVGSMVFYSIN